MRISALLVSLIALFLAQPSRADVTMVNPVAAGAAPGNSLSVINVTSDTFAGQANANALSLGPQAILVASGSGTYPASASLRFVISLTNATFSGTPTITYYA